LTIVLPTFPFWDVAWIEWNNFWKIFIVLFKKDGIFSWILRTSPKHLPTSLEWVLAGWLDGWDVEEW